MIEVKEKDQMGVRVSLLQLFERGLQAAGVCLGMVLLVLLLIPTGLLVLLTAGVWSFTDQVAMRLASKQTRKVRNLSLSQNERPDSAFADRE